MSFVYFFQTNKFYFSGMYIFDTGTHAYVYERGIGKLTMIRAMPITGFVILIIVVGLGILFCLACYFLRKKVKKGCNTILKEICM